MPRKSTYANVATLGIDIGKNTFHVIGLDAQGAIVVKQKLSRLQIGRRFANIPRCLIGMEACVGAHHLSRQLRALGHDARLMPAKYVRPYSKGQKNDYRDAEAIAEAVTRPTMKFVATKTVEQLDMQAMHRVRDRLVSRCTGGHQPDPRLPSGAWYRGTQGRRAAACRPSHDPCDAQRCAVITHAALDRGSGARLAPAR